MVLKRCRNGRYGCQWHPGMGHRRTIRAPTRSRSARKESAKNGRARYDSSDCDVMSAPNAGESRPFTTLGDRTNLAGNVLLRVGWWSPIRQTRPDGETGRQTAPKREGDRMVVLVSQWRRTAVVARIVGRVATPSIPRLPRISPVEIDRTDW